MMLGLLLVVSFLATVLCGNNLQTVSFVPSIKDPVAIAPGEPFSETKPFIDGRYIFHGGKIEQYGGKYINVTSPILDSTTNERVIIGTMAMLTKDEGLSVLDSAKAAWNKGQGVWPQMSLEERIKAIENIVVSLKSRRDEIVNVLMWEICKSATDAAAEFDRTMVFISATIKALRDLEKNEGNWQTVSGILAKVRRAAVGIMMCLGPFNYPFNETYATLIPALLLGNIIVMKVPSTGGLAHILTMEAYAKHLPPGTMNFISGSGRDLMGPLMKTGDIDILAFIGGSKAADELIKAHPAPHRLKSFLQLEGKNLGIVLPDADLDVAADQILVGSTTFNGQRCTAIKLIMLHASIADSFLDVFLPKLQRLGYGLPWKKDVAITPLPEKNKVQSMTALINDAVQKGASVVNSDENTNDLGGGGNVHGALMRPAVVYPVTSEMRLWHEEQFGPVIPVAIFNSTQDILDYYHSSIFGQQAAIFTKDSTLAAPFIDALSTVVGRLNINTQCGRSPDTFPFSGRRSSALGTMSVSEALKVFSIETVVAAKQNTLNEDILRGLETSSTFLSPLTNTNNNEEL